MTSASLGIRGLLERPARPAVVLGVAPAALYLAVGQDVLAVVRRGGVALPNAMLVDSPLPKPAPATVGGGLVRVGAWTAAPASWWDPRPHCGVSISSVYQRSDRHTAVPWAPEGLVGAGPGLTPAGDDVLAGALATLVALRSPLAVSLWKAVRPLLHRTTTLSAALLRHAARGEMAAPAARLLEAWWTGGDVERQVRRLRAVGHTSGPALEHGMRAAWHATAPARPESGVCRLSRNRADQSTHPRVGAAS